MERVCIRAESSGAGPPASLEESDMLTSIFSRLARKSGRIYFAENTVRVRMREKNNFTPQYLHLALQARVRWSNGLEIVRECFVVTESL